MKKPLNETSSVTNFQLFFIALRRVDDQYPKLLHIYNKHKSNVGSGGPEEETSTVANIASTTKNAQSFYIILMNIHAFFMQANEYIKSKKGAAAVKGHKKGRRRLVVE